MPDGGVGRQNANDIINCAKRNYHTLGNGVTMRSSAPSVAPNATKQIPGIFFFSLVNKILFDFIVESP
jgi:hypothetical protein